MIKKQPFGSTGHLSSQVIFGAAALGSVSQAEADRALDLIRQHGINHIDTAASYGDSELRIGPWMKRARSEFFLATKTGERTYAKAREQIRRSLERLQTDQVDLIQLHCLIDPEEWEIAMGPDGALKAALEARDEGLVRFIGVTGHDWHVPQMHMRSLERFEFDSVLLPYNYHMMQNPEYASGFRELEQICKDRGLALQTIKSIAKGRWHDDARRRSTWYEPLESQDAIDKAVSYVLARPGVFLNTVGDVNVLPRVLDAAERHQAAPTDEEMEALLKEHEVTAIFGAK